MTSTVRLPAGLAPAGPRTVPLRIASAGTGLGEVPTAGALPRQAPRLSSATSALRIRKVVTRCAQWKGATVKHVLVRGMCNRGATARTGRLHDAFARQWRRRRCVVENNRTPISIHVPHERRAPSRPPPRADRGTNNRCENSVASCAQSVLLTRRRERNTGATSFVKNSDIRMRRRDRSSADDFREDGPPTKVRLKPDATEEGSKRTAHPDRTGHVIEFGTPRRRHARRGNGRAV